MDLTVVGGRKKGRSLASELIQTLSEQIRSGALAPGEKLPTETLIMEQYGVSRTVVREAISGLQSAGLVTTKHGIGSFVLERASRFRFQLEPTNIPTVLDVLAILEFRVSLESEAASLAAVRRTVSQLDAMRQALNGFQEALQHGSDAADADFQFHLRIAEATGNPYFAEVFAHFGTSSIPRTRVTFPQSPEERSSFMGLLTREHEEIYHAISVGNAKLASKAMRIHLSNSWGRFHKAHEQATRKPELQAV